MHKTFKYLSLALLAMMMWGCADDDSPGKVDDSTITFSFTLADEVGSRAFGDELVADQLTYAIYKVSGEERTLHKTATQPLSENLNVALSKGQLYDVVFWAQASEADCFTFNEADASITVNYDKMTLLSNDEQSDAFFASKRFTAAAGSTVSIRLIRPFAQFNLGTSDLPADGIDETKLGTELKMQGLPTVLNLFDGTVGTPLDQTLTTDGIPGEVFPIEGYKYLAMHYVLCSAEKSLQQPVVITVNHDGAEHARVEVPNLTLQRNYRTNVFGAFISGSTNFDVTVALGFSGSGVQPSESVGSHVGDDGSIIYEIGSSEDMAWLQDKSSDPAWWDGKGIQFTGDINLTDINWVPINVTAPEGKTVTIDGNGKTVSGLNLTESNDQGLFGVAKNVVIKDLTIDGVNLESEAPIKNVGSVAGTLKGSLENVTVRNAKILLNKGTNIGGAVGQMITTGETIEAGETQKTVEEIFASVAVDGCSVLGAESVGGFVGQLSNDGQSRAGEVNVFVRQSGITNTQVLARGSSPQAIGSRAGEGSAGLVAGTVQVENSKVYYDEFTNASNTITEYLGTNNTATWEQIDGKGGGQGDVPGGEYKYDPETATYEVWTLAHLQQAISECETRSPKEDATIKLMGDINCQGAEINPIKLTTGWGIKTVTFDGCDHKIYNAIFKAVNSTTTDNAFAGLFVATSGTDNGTNDVVRGLKVQNLVLENISVKYTGTKLLST